MNDYAKLLFNLTNNHITSDIFLNKITLPNPHCFEQGETPYNFPPNLIPLFRFTDGPSYYGFWLPFFRQNRSNTIVIIHPENHFKVTEIAKNMKQLLDIMCLMMIDNEEDHIALQNFQSKVGGTDISILDKLSLEKGIFESALLPLKHFKTNPPLSCFSENEEDYPGDFPPKKFTPTQSEALEYCSLELSFEAREKLKTQPSAPPWFHETNKKELFDFYLNINDMKSAWLTLNSNGWYLKDRIEAFRKIGTITNDQLLREWSRIWCSLPHSGDILF